MAFLFCSFHRGSIAPVVSLCFVLAGPSTKLTVCAPRDKASYFDFSGVTAPTFFDCALSFLLSKMHTLDTSIGLQASLWSQLWISLFLLLRLIWEHRSVMLGTVCSDYLPDTCVMHVCWRATCIVGSTALCCVPLFNDQLPREAWAVAHLILLCYLASPIASSCARTSIIHTWPCKTKGMTSVI